MSKSTAEIISLYSERKRIQGPHTARAIEVRDQYNGDVVVPLPELDRNEKVAVANLLAQGLDQMSMRIASTQPNPYFPPLRSGVKAEEKAANQRRLCTLSWWRLNKLKLQDRKRARQLIGYASAPTSLSPDFERKIPCWQMRDPLGTYPAPSNNPDSLTPDDCIFAFWQPLRWLREKYPDAAATLSQRRNYDGSPREGSDELFEVIEYTDEEVCVTILMGTKRSPYDPTVSGIETQELVRVPNLAGVCTAVVPGRITLDRPQGQYDGLIGMYQQQAKLQALAVLATEKGVFKDEWLVARPGEIPKVVQMADGRKGIMGVIAGGEYKETSNDPSYMTNPMIDRLERYQRLEGGVPAEFGGESSTNVRTGRRGDSIMSAVIDFPVQEAQELLAMSREEEDKRAIAIDKGYWNRSKSFYVNWNGENKRTDYKPQDLWVNDEHYVTYSHAGADINGLSIVVGQLLGMGLMSKQYAMQTHPLIEDAEKMHDEVIKEGIEAALLSALQSQASQPGANVADFARIMELVGTDQEELAAAITKVHEEAQARQATLDAKGQPTAVDPNAPAAQPGLAAPGQGAEAGAAIQPPGASTQNLGDLLGALRRPQMTLQSERPRVDAAYGHSQ